MPAGSGTSFLDRHNLTSAAAQSPSRREPGALEPGRTRETALTQIEQLHLDLYTALAARMSLAEGAGAPYPTPRSPATPCRRWPPISQLLLKGNFAKELSACQEKVRDTATRKLAARLELLLRNWSAQGNCYWLHQAIEREVAKGQKT